MAFFAGLSLGSQNFSYKKVITISYSTQKMSRNMIFVFSIQFLIWQQKWLKLPQKITIFFSTCSQVNFTHVLPDS